MASYGTLLARWNRISLSNRFLICSAIAVCLAMASIATWMDGQLKESVERNAGLSSARVMESLVAPYLQDLEATRSFSPEARAAIEAFVKRPTLGRRIVQVKIWMPDGTVAYTLDGRHVGERYPLSDDVAGALAGKVMAHFDDIEDAEADDERQLGLKLFEIYTPLLDAKSGQVVAVGEFYEDASILDGEFQKARQHAWLVTGLSTVFILTFLFGMVHRASQLIQRQEAMLQSRIEEQAQLLQQNESLRSKVRRAHGNETAITERFLRRIGSELHDGPAQMLTMALMRFHELMPKPGWDAGKSKPNPGDNPFEAVEAATRDALEDIRNVAAGVAPPQLEARTPVEVLRLVVDNHKRRTGTEVGTEICDVPDSLPLAQKICLFRCSQEGLSNAYRHAGGIGQTVRLETIEDRLILTIKDEGPGFLTTSEHQTKDTLGLAGLRHRVEALEGEFEVISLPDKGTTLKVFLPLARMS